MWITRPNESCLHAHFTEKLRYLESHLVSTLSVNYCEYFSRLIREMVPVREDVPRNKAVCTDAQFHLIAR